jgi:hypothetical protein
LQCGIPTRLMTAVGHSRQTNAADGFAGCPLCLQ